MDSIALASIIGRPVISASGYPAGHVMHNLNRALDTTINLAHEYCDQHRSVAQDPDLSPRGRIAKVRHVGREMVKRLEQQAAVTENARQIAAKLRQKLEAEDAPAGDEDSKAANAIREWEVRTYLEKLDLNDRMVRWHDAIEHGDRLVFDAFRKAPGVLDLLPAPILRDGRTKWYETRNPMLAREVRAVEDGVDTFESTRSLVLAAVTKEANIGPDPVAGDTTTTEGGE